MTTPRHRFIPFTVQRQVAEQLASQTPVPSTGSLYKYDLQKPHDESSDVLGKQMADVIKEWAEANQKVITKFVKPAFFLLKNDKTIILTGKDETSLLVPLFNGTTEVLVRVWGSGARYSIQWNCGFVLHLDEETGIRPLAEDLIFHYNLFCLKADPEAAGPAEQEEEGDESGAGKPRGAV